MKLLLKQSRRAISIALVLMLALTLVPATSAYAASVSIDAVNFPDEVFRNYVKTNFDTNSDGTLSDEELEAVTLIDVNYRGITDLKGVEHFKKLSLLKCGGNKLTTLDITKNTELTQLACYVNQLTTLNVAENTKLGALFCEQNALKALDVAKNTKLGSLICGQNVLKALDVAKNTSLRVLGCGMNELTTLDVTKNTELIYLECENNELSSLNLSANISLQELLCGRNNLTTLDVTKNTELDNLFCDGNKLTSLDLSKNTKIVSDTCSNCKDQTYRVKLTDGKVKFSDLPSGFDASKVSDVTGGEIEGEAFKFAENTLRYKYDTGLTAGGDKIYLEVELKKLRYDVNVTTDGNGTAEPDNERAYEGETVTLTVAPNSGYHFKAWETTPATLVIKSDNTFIMPDSNVTVKAIFEANTVTPPSGGGGGGIVLPPAQPADELKKVKDAATASVADMLKAQTFSGEEQKKAEEIKKNFEDKLAKAATADEVKKIQEEALAAIDVLWSDEEVSLKAKVEAVGRTDLIAKSKVVKTKSGANAVRISWNKVEGLDFDGYEIYRSTSRTKFGKTPIKTADGAKTSYLNTKNLGKGRTYYYKIKAFKTVNGEKVYTDFSTRTWKTPKK